MKKYRFNNQFSRVSNREWQVMRFFNSSDQERIKAKLFTAAKEKLAAKAREKDAQLQAERRKKAMEFINLLQECKRIQTGNGASELKFTVKD